MEKDLIFGILCTSIAFALLLVAAVAILFISRRKRMKVKMQITELELTYERELRKAESEMGEQMMERFAQELHDNIGHSLTYIRMDIETKKLDNPTLEEPFQHIEKHLNDASQQLRLLSRSLNSDYVADLKIEEAIKLEVDRLDKLKRHAVHLDVTGGTVALDKNQTIMTFRIFQEIVHNVLRHSKAANLQITLSDENGFALVVTDDGKGFDVDEVLHSSRASGLKNIFKRAELAGMRCEITSAPGNGCSYALRKAPLS